MPFKFFLVFEIDRFLSDFIGLTTSIQPVQIWTDLFELNNYTVQKLI